MKYALIAALALTACAKSNPTSAPSNPLNCTSYGTQVLCTGSNLNQTTAPLDYSQTYPNGTVQSIQVTNGTKKGTCALFTLIDQTSITYCGKYVDSSNQLDWRLE